ncbi:MAG: N-acetylmuramoyl-L-alanine amidase [Gemmatimonadota bacterium]|nr:N-acetylmuramoyl-L-alanine amidase [Gemmatimonadota bacterium]
MTSVRWRARRVRDEQAGTPLMILSVLAAFQIGIAPPAPIVVRGERVTAQAPVVLNGGAAAVGLERLAPVIPMSIRPGADGLFTVTMLGAELEMTDRLPFVKVNGSLIPLSGAPYAAEGRLYVPLQLITDVLPRALPKRLRYTASTRELRYLPEVEPLAAPTVFRSTGSARTRGAAPATPQRQVGPSRKVGRRWRVIVDAGHGGVDNGMTGPIHGGPKIFEKDITLQVAERVRAALITRGIDVVMTRTYDTLIALSDRGKIANENHGDLFISVHVNAAPLTSHKPQDWRGFETYFLAEAKTEDDRRVERMENESIRFETNAEAAPGDPLSYVISDMAQNEHLRESSELADFIQRRLARMHPGPDRGVKQAGFRVLVTAFMPSVLVEIGFGTNQSESQYISTAAHQQQLANTIADAALEYLSQYERRLGTAER